MKRLPILLLVALLVPAAVGAGSWRVISEDNAGITVEFTTGRPSITSGGAEVWLSDYQDIPWRGYRACPYFQ